MVKNLPSMRETQVQSLGWNDLLEKGMAIPFQYSCLGNPLDRGAWRAVVHGVENDWTQLSDWHFLLPSPLYKSWVPLNKEVRPSGGCLQCSREWPSLWSTRDSRLVSSWYVFPSQVHHMGWWPLRLCSRQMIPTYGIWETLAYIYCSDCSVMSDLATPWTIACQAPLSMAFSRQEY